MTIFHFTYFFHSALNFFKKEPDNLRYFFLRYFKYSIKNYMRHCGPAMLTKFANTLFILLRLPRQLLNITDKVLKLWRKMPQRKFNGSSQEN